MNFKTVYFLFTFLSMIVLISGCISSTDPQPNNNSPTQTSLQESGYTTINASTCTPDWNCSSWSECLPTGIQVRTCTDKNNCSANAENWVDSNTCTHMPTNITAATLSIQDLGNRTDVLVEKSCASNSEGRTDLPGCTAQNYQTTVPGTRKYISNPTIQIINTGTSDLNDITIDVHILNKDGVVLMSMSNVRYLQGRDTIKIVYKGDNVVGTLDYFVGLMSGTFPSGHYILKVDLRRGASTKIIATDGKGFDI